MKWSLLETIFVCIAVLQVNILSEHFVRIEFRGLTLTQTVVIENEVWVIIAKKSRFGVCRSKRDKQFYEER